MIKGYKVMLLPNNKQNSKLFECAGVARWSYNWALSKEEEAYKSNNKYINDRNLRKELTQLKKTKEHDWLNNYSCDISKQAIKDACIAYDRFFKKQSNFPKYKSKKKSKPKFFVDSYLIQFTDSAVRLSKLTTSNKRNKQKLNWVKLAEKNRIPLNCKYINPRVTYDGIHWWISVAIEYENDIFSPDNDIGIGIDLGIKNLAICSDGKIYDNINKSVCIAKLSNRKRKLQRKISKKYLKNKEGDSYCKTNNIVKYEAKLLKLSHRITNIRHNYIHQTTSDIVNRKPSFIVLEDLDVMGMLKNKHLAKAIQEQSFYEFYRQIKYKCEWNKIVFIEANRFYPSSKLCSKCGCVHKNLLLSDRIFVCPDCGNTIDRDYQASVNLENYGYSYLNMDIVK